MRKVEALVLAAGLGRRFAASGGGPKLGAMLGSKPLVRHVAEAACASRAARTIVVTGHRPEMVQTVLADLDVTFAHNPEFADGLSTSLLCGLHRVAPDTVGLIVLLGDMPRVSASLIDALIARFEACDTRYAAVVPAVAGMWGNPVLIARALFPALEALRGDRGARSVLEGAEVDVLTTDDPAVLFDIDTTDALAAAQVP